jgi:hypothetical protein
LVGFSNYKEAERIGKVVDQGAPELVDNVLGGSASLTAPHSTISPPGLRWAPARDALPGGASTCTR